MSPDLNVLSTRRVCSTPVSADGVCVLRFSVAVLIYVFSYFLFGFEGRLWDLIVSVPDHCLSFYFMCEMLTIHSHKPGAVARSEACSLGMQEAPSSIPTSGTFFRGDLVMKTFLRPFSLFR